MSLAARLTANFSANARKRGEQYHREGRVYIGEGSESSISALVEGSQSYKVDLNFINGTLSVSCDCPYFGDTGTLCKHLWAVVVTADERGYLGELASAASFGLELHDYDNYNDYDFDDEFDHEPRDRQPLTAYQIPQSPAALRNLPASNRSSPQRRLAEFLGHPARAMRSEARWPAGREILYLIDVANSLSGQGLSLSLQFRDRKMDGSWRAPRPFMAIRSDIAQMAIAEDREILSALAGGEQYSYFTYERIPDSFSLRPALAGLLMPLMARTGRCSLRTNNGSNALTPITWDADGAWNFELEIHRAGDRRFALSGCFRRKEEYMELGVPVLVTPGLLFTMDRVAAFIHEAAWEWILALRTKGSFTFSEAQQDEFLSILLASPNLPPLTAPKEMSWQEVMLPAQPHLKIFKYKDPYREERLRAELLFAYEDRLISHSDPARGFFDSTSRRFVRRDLDAERTAADLLDQLGVKARRASNFESELVRDLAPSKLSSIVRSLLSAGWHVEAEKKLFRRPGSFQLEISSGIDWFELHGKVEYGNTTAHLPELLEAFRRGEQMVQLADGSYGMLPEEWLRQFGPVTAMGTVENGHIRFKRSQAALLDALLAAQPGIRYDDYFAALRHELQGFNGINPDKQPAGFVGTLRDYQCDGLGWMQFLRRAAFGGCLADDMGVGKTAQVLALLELRRELRAAGEPHGPSLVVVPKSLVFNWKEEAARFTPQLRVLVYTGAARNGDDFAAYDVVLTTYGILRRDILRLKDLEFDYIVLDEAQAIKNANAQTSKAMRLLQGRHRLALSGTPVENHLGELWSLFEFLNPGMLGTASVFKLGGGTMLNPDEKTRHLLSQALRPFILRRTKEQVARELPPKSEQTLYCEMEAAERRRYEDLRQHYRASLLKRIEKEGLAKSKIQVLEALLRLRQAACHPGLLSTERSGEPSAKLELLLEQLGEVLEAGHKALVFSQFTSFLKIVRNRLDRIGITYEYLDGATRDRQRRVERFQTDNDCMAFLISLKAGGLGLNLTAAEYIFILDPWWNPAAEAQAVDRAHRIGQTRPIFAYRLITRETVEEKVLELQKVKRDLAASIITANNSLIRNLQPDDLALLLS
ncbi:MAG: DEAD/DEAH box helicase [Deltaproteobacteria bacterium]|nr:DEAD/DEAH box helicase [Deltaproteobacteria bacterium]